MKFTQPCIDKDPMFVEFIYWNGNKYKVFLQSSLQIMNLYGKILVDGELEDVGLNKAAIPVSCIIIQRFNKHGDKVVDVQKVIVGSSRIDAKCVWQKAKKVLHRIAIDQFEDELVRLNLIDYESIDRAMLRALAGEARHRGFLKSRQHYDISMVTWEEIAPVKE